MNSNAKFGLGYRRSMTETLLEGSAIQPDFVEVAPENWLHVGGVWKKRFNSIAEKYPILCHGLSLSIGSPDDLDIPFIRDIKAFLDQYNVPIYSEHLSFSKCENAHLYDLLPIPFREDAVDHIAKRIQVVQDILERPLVLENVSYYTPVGAEMDEADFINAIVSQSGCKLLLDVNNVYVNAFNHGYDAVEFIQKMPLDSVAYMHMAGHHKVKPDLIVDTHGAAIIDPVYELFEFTTSLTKPVPVLLERDFNIPELSELNGELNRLKEIASAQWTKQMSHA